MSLAEISHSVVVEPKQNPDTTSLSRAENGMKLIEPKGVTVKRATDAINRAFILQHRGDTSVTFEPTADLDTIIFYKNGASKTHYAARNGVYVEMGAVNSSGERVAAQYSLEEGIQISITEEIGAFPRVEVPQTIDTNHIALVMEACEELRINKLTPNPLMLAVVEDVVSSTIRTSFPETSFQPKFSL